MDKIKTMESLRQIFERETGEPKVMYCPTKYAHWLEKGISKEYEKRDRIIAVQLKIIENLRGILYKLQEARW